MLAIRISQRRWRTACRYALILSSAFLAFSAVTLVAGVESNKFLALGPSCYLLGSVGVFFTMVRAGGALAPISWYILGTGLYFGLGTAVWGLVPNLHRNSTLGAGLGDLARVNLLNSASIFLVLITALFFSARRVTLPSSVHFQKLNWVVIYRLVIPLVIISIALDYYFFPLAQDLIVSSLQSKLSLVVPMYLLMTGLLWKNISSNYKVLSLIIVTSILVKAVLSFSKTEMLYPILCILGGYWAVNRSFKSLVAPLLAMGVLLVFVLMPMVKDGRESGSYNAARNSLSERAEILGSDYGNRGTAAAEGASVQSLARFSHAPFQRFLMDEYLAGRNGNSLADVWAALVPRILWTEKPSITRFGIELYQLFFRSRASSTSLAPTYSAEAYWNYGSIGVVSISVLLGLQLGWLTKCWFYAIQGHRQSYLIIAFPAAFFGLNVETWIAATYFGGFITLIIMWWVVELFMSVVMRRKQRKRFVNVVFEP